MALVLVIGSVIGAFAGARLLGRIPEQPLKVIVAVSLVVLGAKELVFP
jgi:uncharacterized membrane protein YfcA